jgi:hypothetical protein
MTTNDDPENLPACPRCRGTFSEAFIRRGELSAAYEAGFWDGYRAAVWREARGGPDEWPAQVMVRRRDDYMTEV